jgi:hypothetical protein
MNFLHAITGTLLLGAAFAATGCGGYGSFCTDAMDCARGNDNDIEACELAFEHDEEIASIYGCDQEWDDYYLCLEERSDCNDRVFGPDGNECADEAQDYGDCVN